jgi:hypothetical protein
LLVVANTSTGEYGDDEPSEGEDEGPQSHANVSRRCQAVAGAGIEILQRLADGPDDGAKVHQLPDDVLLVMAAFTDQDDDWTNDDVCAVARAVLSKQLSTYHDHAEFLTNVVLKGYLAPLFKTSRPSAITASGRKREFTDSLEKPRGLPDETRKTKPWKYMHLGSVAVLTWVLSEADVGSPIFIVWVCFGLFSLPGLTT